MKNLSVEELKLQQSTTYLPVLSNETDYLVSAIPFQNNNDSNIKVAKVIAGLNEYSVYAPKKEGKFDNLYIYENMLSNIISIRQENNIILNNYYENTVKNISNLIVLNINYISQTDFDEKIENKTISNGVNIIIYDDYDMKNKQIINLGDPKNDNDAVNKKYFDENAYSKLIELQKKYAKLSAEINSYLSTFKN